MARRRTDGITGSGRHRFTVLATLILLLAACGGDDDGLEVADESDMDAEEVEDLEAEAEDPEESAEEPEEDDDADDGSGLNSHRPTAEADAVADCDKIVAEEPGASIAFPSEEGEGWLDAGEGPVTVEFMGCSNTFEANVVYEAFHGEDRKPTLSGHTMGGTMGQWDRFSFEETFWTPGEWTVVVFEDDAESGDRREYDEVTFTVE